MYNQPRAHISKTKPNCVLYVTTKLENMHLIRSKSNNLRYLARKHKYKKYGIKKSYFRDQKHAIVCSFSDRV